MLRRWLGAFLFGSLALTACDRFGHAKYERSPWGAPAAADGASVAAEATDAIVQGCSSAAAPSIASGRAAGAACSTATECAAVCCGCGDALEWQAFSCVGGVCANAETACRRTDACAAPGGLVVIGAGGAGPGPTGCGLTFDDASCDACMQASCCAPEAACANDRTCSGIGDCIAACSDDACVAACESAYASNGAAGALDACLAASCASSCR